jgi:hypothetical protein
MGTAKSEAMFEIYNLNYPYDVLTEAAADGEAGEVSNTLESLSNT